MGKLQWYGPQVIAAIQGELGRRLARSCLLIANHAKELLSVEGTEPGRKKGSKLRYHAAPSQPGEPPHVQTGRLRGSVAWELVGLVGRVGSNLLYGRALELGTRLMAARPWLRRAAREKQPEVTAILSRPLRGPD